MSFTDNTINKTQILDLFFKVQFKVKEVTTFLLEDKTPMPNSDLTDKHYIGVIDLLLEEKRARQQLEVAVTQLHQELLTKTSHLPTPNGDNNVTEKCKADLQVMKNYSDNIQRELTAEINLLKHEHSLFQQNFSTLQLENSDIKRRLKNSENRSFEESKKFQNDINSLKQLKGIDQLQDVHTLQTQFETIQRQVQLLSSVQSARGEDFLALYNQSLKMKSILTQTTDVSNNHSDSIIQVRNDLTRANLTTYDLKTEFKHEVSRLNQQIKDGNRARGTVYVRWSRKQCSGNQTELVYSGYTGGGHYDERGSPAEPVCLPPDPDFVKTSSGQHGRMYGAEFYSNNNVFPSNSQYQDIPCAVCRVKQASSVIMIPGKNRCYTGWNMEYHGYLASNYYNAVAAGSYVCIDIQPEYVSGGSSWNSKSKLVYDVVAKCGSLRCPPYKQDYPLTCVVCSK
ncbi:unnamed protein product [Mytilus coruscus]|uniref:Uncharacterized protein n=1 Tax=Mytilus coruscus TaxID=42192 RepID=A0A6J8EJW9_MYTCO|nr:unnamed protein product [Mytilus coruscus]